MAEKPISTQCFHMILDQDSGKDMIVDFLLYDYRVLACITIIDFTVQTAYNKIWRGTHNMKQLITHNYAKLVNQYWPRIFTLRSTFDAPLFLELLAMAKVAQRAPNFPS